MKSNHYVDNQLLNKLLVEYFYAKKENPNIRVSDQIGKMIIAIARNISHRYNFSNYTFLDEMVSDGIYDAFRSVNTFDPEKSNNPFGYLSRIIFRAFVRRIVKENKERQNRNDLAYEDIDSFSQNEFDNKVNIDVQDWDSR